MTKHVMFSTDGEGHWVRREWSPQCQEKVFLRGRCQGIEGHKGVHWCYDPSGSFAWDDNDADPQHGGCSGSTPPDHKNYVPPIDKQEDYHLSHYVDTEVTDPEEIARLERGDIQEGESINGPVKDEKLLKMLEERLKDYEEL